MLALQLESGDRLLKHRLVILAPAIQHVHVAANHGDGRAQLVTRVIHEAHLLQLGVLHLPKQSVERNLDALEVLVTGPHARGVDACPLDGLLEAGHLVLTGCRRPARRGSQGVRAHERVRLQGQVVQRLELPAHTAHVREEGHEREELCDHQRGEGAKQNGEERA